MNNVFTDEEKLALDSLVSDIRAIAENLENASDMKDSNYIPGMTGHVDTIFAGYRKVLLLKERELRTIQNKFRDRKLG